MLQQLTMPYRPADPQTALVSPGMRAPSRPPTIGPSDSWAGVGAAATMPAKRARAMAEIFIFVMLVRGELGETCRELIIL